MHLLDDFGGDAAGFGGVQLLLDAGFLLLHKKAIFLIGLRKFGDFATVASMEGEGESLSSEFRVRSFEFGLQLSHQFGVSGIFFHA